MTDHGEPVVVGGMSYLSSIDEVLKLVDRIVVDTTKHRLESYPIALDLPAELLLLIFSFLTPRERYTKKPDIRSCRLVCRLWADVAMEVLFHDIHVSAWAFSECPDDTLSERFVKKLFLAFLESNPRIGHRVRFLRIHFGWECASSPTADYHYEIQAEVIKRLLELVPQLEGLSLYRILFRDPMKLATLETWRPAPLRSLTVDFALRFILPLNEDNESLSCDEELRKIFAYFTGIRDLTLAGYNHTRNDTTRESEHVKGFPPALQSLTLRSSYPHDNLLNTIIASTSGGTLQNLFISLFSDVERTLRDNLGQFLVAVGPSLTSMGYGAECKPACTQNGSLQAYFESLLNRPPHIIRVTACANIHTLRCLVPIFSPGRVGGSGPLSRVAGILSPDLPQSRKKLRNIHLILLVSDHSIEDLTPGHVQLLDAALFAVCEVAPSICVKVAVCLGKGGAGSLDESMLAHWFPKLATLRVPQLGDLEEVGMTKEHMPSYFAE
ncbi:hypothetical protein PHLGIDRAFT_118500 [Phlebiopsis gigantea 11061_1 CR5-6]|uniref:F-box domain-containing protein n=1 Tax=Phlebiopsis gigantea (strain 11061_1 CR5-6) TaxID=745531 RepID=A0A0C3SAE8_PHLG1|nr:hypothetical protein PHLGIDRAFT_118500 [Phlebiopsis gigantea 11061_1 CR5-6]